MEVDDEQYDEVGARDDMEGLINDLFGEGVTAGPNAEAEKFYGLMERASQELYPG
ncbi:hypothetical protein PIB30_114910, partial [Stylosanthes scabra]|nr:hypothetical protein [Stylosanthes scabra]